MPTVVALLTARGNNSFQHKHLATVLDHPLVWYPAAAGRQSHKIDEYYASSDDDEILRVTEQLGYRSIKRPPEISGPASQHRDALTHALAIMSREKVMPEILVVLLGNAAVIKPAWIDDCIAILQADDTISAAVPAVKEMDHHPYRAKRVGTDGALTSFFDFKGRSISTNRQDLPACYFLSHNFWVIRVTASALADSGEPPWDFLGNKVVPYELQFSQDVHEPADLVPTEAWLRTELRQPSPIGQVCS
jgi:CMP-N-acetylneuraminic acid synthetase